MVLTILIAVNRPYIYTNIALFVRQHISLIFEYSYIFKKIFAFWFRISELKVIHCGVIFIAQKICCYIYIRVPEFNSLNTSKFNDIFRMRIWYTIHLYKECSENETHVSVYLKNLPHKEDIQFILINI